MSACSAAYIRTQVRTKQTTPCSFLSIRESKHFLRRLEFRSLRLAKEQNVTEVYRFLFNA